MSKKLSIPFLVLPLFMTLLPLAAAGQPHYKQTNLVSDVPGLAATTDPDLVNPWGLSRSATSPWWVSDNGTGKSTLYNGTGTKLARTVDVPGAPTGVVFNGTSGFEVSPGAPSRFIFASEDGTISGWSPVVDSTHALVVFDDPQAIYKG